MTSVAVLGSTGSIGTQTLDVIRNSPEDFSVDVLAAGSSADQVMKQIVEFKPQVVVMAQPKAADKIRSEFHDLQVYSGQEALEKAATQSDVVVNAIVGFAGLPVTLSALKAGKRLALANKESLIAGGPVVRKVRKTLNAEIIPVDSEHCALHQCLKDNSVNLENPNDFVKKLLITASGRPFREWHEAQLQEITVDDALKHPTWNMGPKITIDSSTLMNKGLEVIEAHELFAIPYDQIQVVVHPQSIVHSMVEFVDSSVIAQMSMPDMRLPITYALQYPKRGRASWGAIDWSSLKRLDFDEPNKKAFPCLELAFQAGKIGETAPAWLNAANEIAVEAFLNGKIPWIKISTIIEETLNKYDSGLAETENDIYTADAKARLTAQTILENFDHGQ
ncbi:MAG: 1-deoxy-D-xylulose-5-phosphate reductoisomerase [Acidimicrobiaceae bacterium]|nr:1-deoxy-D-xylulose-5-phosphate reductoisomerase [Acidimicrobiaceae bacterium]